VLTRECVFGAATLLWPLAATTRVLKGPSLSLQNQRIRSSALDTCSAVLVSGCAVSDAELLLGLSPSSLLRKWSWVRMLSAVLFMAFSDELLSCRLPSRVCSCSSRVAFSDWSGWST
jgi:hypothetical protein